MVLFKYVIEKMKTKVIGNARSAIARGDVYNMIMLLKKPKSTVMDLILLILK